MQDYIASHALDGTPFPDAPRKVRDERCRVVIQTEAALSFLKRRAAKPEQPWFLYLAYMAPHVPLESPEPWFSKTPAHLPKERRQALALIGAIDDGVGRIRAKLREMGAGAEHAHLLHRRQRRAARRRLGRLPQPADARAERDAQRRRHPRAIPRRVAGQDSRRARSTTIPSSASMSPRPP